MSVQIRSPSADNMTGWFALESRCISFCVLGLCTVDHLPQTHAAFGCSYRSLSHLSLQRPHDSSCMFFRSLLPVMTSGMNIRQTSQQQRLCLLLRQCICWLHTRQHTEPSTHSFRKSNPEPGMSLNARSVLTVLDSFCSVPAVIEIHSEG